MTQGNMHNMNHSTLNSIYNGSYNYGNAINPITTQQIPGLTQGQQLSLGSLSVADIHTLTGLDLGLTHPEIKKYEVYDIPEDLLALSVAWKRIRLEDAQQNGPKTITRLLDRRLFDRVTHEDRTQANDIRDYYSKKLMVLKLKDSKITKYREDLNKFIQTDGKTFQESFLGLAYYLPMFYEYDCEIDYIKSCVSTKLDDSMYKRMHSVDTIAVKPIKRIIRNTRSVKSVQYWFKESLTDNAVCITLGKDNDLEHIWNHMFQQGNEMRIQAKLDSRSIDGFHFINLRRWELVLA